MHWIVNTVFLHFLWFSGLGLGPRDRCSFVNPFTLYIYNIIFMFKRCRGYIYKVSSRVLYSGYIIKYTTLLLAWNLNLNQIYFVKMYLLVIDNVLLQGNIEYLLLNLQVSYISHYVKYRYCIVTREYWVPTTQSKGFLHLTLC